MEPVDDLGKSRALSGQKRILSVSIKRTRGGVRVRLYGGKEIRDFFSAIAENNRRVYGSRLTQTYPVGDGSESVECWRDVTPYSDRMDAMGNPAGIGPWLLRATQLGASETEPLEILFHNYVCSADMARRCRDKIADAARTFYAEYLKPFSVSADVYSGTGA